MPILTEEERLGQLIARRYRLEAILSTGGMGVLFRAKDEQTGEAVAVKMLKPVFAQDGDRVARFLRETRISAALRHEHIAEVRDIWQDDDGIPFLILELLDGCSLEHELAERGVLSLEETLSIVLPVTSALSLAHRKGVIHRDVKPANIFLCKNAAGVVVPKLLDFGIAKTASSEFETQTGIVVGTPGYMAPEQAQHGECGPFTDVWGMAAVAYRCLTGRTPHTGNSVGEILAKLVREPVRPLDVPGVSRALATTIDRALSRHPDRRYPTAEAFKEALETAMHPDSGVATLDAADPDGSWPSVTLEKQEPARATRPPARSSWLRSLSLVALGAGLSLGFIATRGVFEPQRPSTPVDTPARAEAGGAIQSAAPTPVPPAEVSGSPLIQPPAEEAARPREAAIRPAPRAAPRPASTPASKAAPEPVRVAPPAAIEHDPGSGLPVATEW